MRKQVMSAAKETGNKFFERKDYAKAIEWYSKGTYTETQCSGKAALHK